MIKKYLIFLLIFVSCKDTNDLKKTNELKKNKSEHIHIQDSLIYEDLMMLTKLKAIEKYGLPNSEERFILNDLQGEFRIGLYNIYTKEERLSETILIDEITWEKDGDTYITVWYQVNNNSIPKDVLIWKKGMEF